MITRRQFIGAVGFMTAAAAGRLLLTRADGRKSLPCPPISMRRSSSRNWLKKGSGFVVGNEKADTVVMMAFDTQCRWCAWEYEQFKPFP